MPVTKQWTHDPSIVWVKSALHFRTSPGSALGKERDLLGLAHAPDRRQGIVGRWLGGLQNSVGDNRRAERGLDRSGRSACNDRRGRGRKRRRLGGLREGLDDR